MGFLGTIYAMFAFKWSDMGDKFENRLCNFIMIILLTVFAVFMLVMQSGQYKTYAAKYHLAYSDMYGMIGGFIAGVLSAWILLPKSPGDAFHTKC